MLMKLSLKNVFFEMCSLPPQHLIYPFFPPGSQEDSSAAQNVCNTPSAA